jgi:hypothetical protein
MSSNGSSQAREAGLRKITLAKRWLVAGSVTLTGVLAAVAANAFPGKPVKASGAALTDEASTNAASSGSAQQATENSQGSSSSLTPPSQAPQSTETGESASRESAPAEQSESARSTSETPVVSGGS